MVKQQTLCLFCGSYRSSYKASDKTVICAKPECDMYWTDEEAFTVMSETARNEFNAYFSRSEETATN